MTADEQRLALIGDDLDGLLVDLETSFWIEFDRVDIVECYTLGHLFDRVMSKMGALGEARCISSFAFYRLRKVLADSCGCNRKGITPNTKLATFLPWTTRKSAWEKLGTDLRISLPQLEPSTSITMGSLLVALIGVLLFTWPAEKLGLVSLTKLVLGGFLWTILAWLLCLIVTKPFHRAFPEQIVTVGDLAHTIVRRNYKKIATEAGGATMPQAWRAFQELIAAVSGLSPSQVRRDMLFPQDLEIY